MKFIVSVLLPAVLVLSCSHKSSAPVKALVPKKEWIRQSDAISERYTRDLAELMPETASFIGLTEFDGMATPFDNNYQKRKDLLNSKWVSILNEEEKKDYPLETKEDIRILRNFVQLQLEYSRVQKKYKQIDFAAFSKQIFAAIQVLVNPQVEASRKAKAVDRFKAYVHGFEQYKPASVAIYEFYQSQQEEFKGHKKLYSPRREVEIYLQQSPQYVEGVKQLLAMTGRDDWKEDFEKFKEQSTQYDAWLKQEYLPKARKDTRLPKEIYALNLRALGIEMSPEELIQLGQSGYRELYPEFAKLAKSLSNKHKIKTSNPSEVIAFFKKSQVVNPDDVKKLYYGASDRLQLVIKEHQLVSLPTAPLQIRLAGEAESLAQPVPHLNPPSFVNNDGSIRPEFVVPTAKDKMPIDDFSSEHAAYGLTAHEGRPGHDLQFSRMIDLGVSTIRATYAMNSTNVEGWALYAEDLVYPYATDEEKLFLLQMRLWRMARAYLDPQIQLGVIKDHRVIDVFTRELGVSKEMANLELRRYSFDSPGQAPAYYYGYTLLKNARAKAEKMQGVKFKALCFNDQVLSYGMLPVKMIAEYLEKTPDSCVVTTGLKQ